MPFWSDPQTSPKRVHRWIMHIGGIPTYVVKTAERPKRKLSEAEHAFLVHTFYFPGRIQWEEMKITFVDVVNPDTTELLLEIMENAGYHFPEEGDHRTITKAQAVAALGRPMLDLLGGDGVPIERWTFKNAFLKNFSSDELKYDSEELLGMEVTMRFDWAEKVVLTAADIAG